MRSLLRRLVSLRAILKPAAELRRSKVLFLVRDPRDAFVSHYVQLTRPSADAPEELKKLTPSEILRDSFFGIEQIVRTVNDWLDEFRDRPNVTLVRYEDLKNDPGTHFVNVLAAVGEAEISQPPFEAALQFSRSGT